MGIDQTRQAPTVASFCFHLSHAARAAAALEIVGKQRRVTNVAADEQQDSHLLAPVEAGAAKDLQCGIYPANLARTRRGPGDRQAAQPWPPLVDSALGRRPLPQAVPPAFLGCRNRRWCADGGILHQYQQFVFRTDVPVERHRGTAERLGDGRQRDTSNPLTIGNVDCGVDYASHVERGRSAHR
jgi:hypothetical protein